MPAAPQPVLTETYTSEKDMRNDIARKLAQGYVVSSTNITEHRGAAMSGCGCLTLGIFTFMLPKKKHFHVTYLYQPPVPATPATPAPPSGSSF